MIIDLKSESAQIDFLLIWEFCRILKEDVTLVLAEDSTLLGSFPGIVTGL